MNIGIIGAGNIGQAAARLFIDAGHKVALANSRGPETLQSVVAELGAGAQAATIEDAAQFGEVVLVAIPLGKFETLPVEAFRDRIVIDANNYYPSRDGRMNELESGEITSSEMLQAHLTAARVVKGFNTIWSEHLKTQGDKRLPLAQRRVIFIASDDSQAKETVAKLIEEIGFAAVDTGMLGAGGKLQQPDTPVYNKTLSVPEAQALLS